MGEKVMAQAGRNDEEDEEFFDTPESMSVWSDEVEQEGGLGDKMRDFDTSLDGTDPHHSSTTESSLAAAATAGKKGTIKKSHSDVDLSLAAKSRGLAGLKVSCFSEPGVKEVRETEKKVERNTVVNREQEGGGEQEQEQEKQPEQEQQKQGQEEEQGGEKNNFVSRRSLSFDGALTSSTKGMGQDVLSAATSQHVAISQPDLTLAAGDQSRSAYRCNLQFSRSLTAGARGTGGLRNTLPLHPGDKGGGGKKACKDMSIWTNDPGTVQERRERVWQQLMLDSQRKSGSPSPSTGDGTGGAVSTQGSRSQQGFSHSTPISPQDTGGGKYGRRAQTVHSSPLTLSPLDPRSGRGGHVAASTPPLSPRRLLGSRLLSGTPPMSPRSRKKAQLSACTPPLSPRSRAARGGFVTPPLSPGQVAVAAARESEANAYYDTETGGSGASTPGSISRCSSGPSGVGYGLAGGVDLTHAQALDRALKSRLKLAALSGSETEKARPWPKRLGMRRSIPKARSSSGGASPQLTPGGGEGGVYDAAAQLSRQLSRARTSDPSSASSAEKFRLQSSLKQSMRAGAEAGAKIMWGRSRSMRVAGTFVPSGSLKEAATAVAALATTKSPAATADAVVAVEIEPPPKKTLSWGRSKSMRYDRQPTPPPGAALLQRDDSDTTAATAAAAPGGSKKEKDRQAAAPGGELAVRGPIKWGRSKSVRPDRSSPQHERGSTPPLAVRRTAFDLATEELTLPMPGSGASAKEGGASVAQRGDAGKGFKKREEVEKLGPPAAAKGRRPRGGSMPVERILEDSFAEEDEAPPGGGRAGGGGDERTAAEDEAPQLDTNSRPGETIQQQRGSSAGTQSPGKASVRGAHEEEHSLRAGGDAVYTIKDLDSGKRFMVETDRLESGAAQAANGGVAGCGRAAAEGGAAGGSTVTEVGTGRVMAYDQFERDVVGVGVSPLLRELARRERELATCEGGSSSSDDDAARLKEKLRQVERKAGKRQRLLKFVKGVGAIYGGSGGGGRSRKGAAGGGTSGEATPDGAETEGEGGAPEVAGEAADNKEGGNEPSSSSSSSAAATARHKLGQHSKSRRGGGKDAAAAAAAADEQVKVHVHVHKKVVREFTDMVQGQEIRAHAGPIWALQFSHDGQFLASAGQDGVVCIWEVLPHPPWQAPAEQPDNVAAVAAAGPSAQGGGTATASEAWATTASASGSASASPSHAGPSSSFGSALHAPQDSAFGSGRTLSGEETPTGSGSLSRAGSGTSWAGDSAAPVLPDGASAAVEGGGASAPDHRLVGGLARLTRQASTKAGRFGARVGNKLKGRSGSGQLGLPGSRLGAEGRPRTDGRPGSEGHGGATFWLREQATRTLLGHKADVLDLSWTKSEQLFLLSASMDKTVRLWHAGFDHCLRVFVHTDFVTSVDFNPADDQVFGSGSLDEKLRVWSVPDRAVVGWSHTREMITALSFTPNGKTLVVGSYKGTCRLYSIEGHKLTLTSQLEALGDDPLHLLVTSNDSRVRSYLGADLACCKFKGLQNLSSQGAASYSALGDFVVCASEDSKIYVWNDGPAHAAATAAAAKRESRVVAYECFEARRATIAIFWPGSKPAAPPVDLSQPLGGGDRNENDGAEGGGGVGGGVAGGGGDGQVGQPAGRGLERGGGGGEGGSRLYTLGLGLGLEVGVGLGFALGLKLRS
eukprot:jgi/Mesen1/2916/ME000175S02076